jgi:hypothetical protein
MNFIQRIFTGYKLTIPDFEKVQVYTACRTRYPGVITLWSKDEKILREFVVVNTLEMSVQDKKLTFHTYAHLQKTTLEVCKKGNVFYYNS